MLQNQVILFWIGLVVFLIFLLYLNLILKVLKIIKEKELGRVQPWIAWLLLIPYAGLVVHFVIVNDISNAMMKWGKANDIAFKDGGKKVGFSLCILSVIVILLKFLPPKAFYVLIILIPIIVLILWFIWWNKINNFEAAINKISK